MRRVSIPVSASSSATTGPKVWPSKGIGVQHKLAAPAFARAGFWDWSRGSPPTPLLSQGQALAAELVGRPGFAFADAFDLRSVQRIDFGDALSVILETHPPGQGEPVGKALLQRLIAGDLAADVAR